MWYIWISGSQTNLPLAKERDSEHPRFEGLWVLKLISHSFSPLMFQKKKNPYVSKWAALKQASQLWGESRP